MKTSMSQNKKCLVIIPVYNGEKYLPSLLNSLEQAFFVWPNFSVLFIDDQSTDGSQQIINDFKRDWLSAVINSEKKFFVGSCNFGLQKGIADGYEYAFLLNQDTEASNEVLPGLTAELDVDQTLAGLQPIIRLYPQTDLINSRGCAIHIFGLGYTIGHKTKYISESKQIVPIAYASGAGVMYRLSALAKVGLLAQNYEMYHEDLELGWRLWLAGWRCACLTNIYIYHKHEFNRSISRVYYMERNRWLFIFSRYSVLLLILLLPGLFIFEIALLLLSLKNGWFTQKLKTYKYLLQSQTWDYIKSERQNMKKWLKVEDKNLIWLLTSEVKYQDLGDGGIVNFGNKAISFYWSIVKKIINI